jgi:hypothetical protein
MQPVEIFGKGMTLAPILQEQEIYNGKKNIAEILLNFYASAESKS